ncbi:DNA gyrase subunit A [compost metagenome]
MVTPEDVLVTLSNEGYLKRTSKLSFTRSGGELENTGVKEGDFVRFLLDVNTIESLLIFTQKGQCYVLPIHQIPEYKWKENGTAIVNIIPIAKEDRIANVIPVKGFEDPSKSLVFVTRKGQVKRTELKEYMTNRSNGIVACKLGHQDEVLTVHLSDNTKEILLVSKQGMSIRFREEEVNPMGRAAAGVRGMQLKDDDEIISAEWIYGDEGEVLVISDLGYAKRSLVVDYPIQGRGGKGILTFEFKEGKRVRPNGTAIIRIFIVKMDYAITAIMSNGERKRFSTETAPLEDRKSSGKQLIPVTKTESIMHVLRFP